MAIRRQPFSRIRVDRVTDRWEILLTLGAWFSLRLRRSTRTMTVYLPGPPPIAYLPPPAPCSTPRYVRRAGLQGIEYQPDRDSPVNIAFIGGAQAAAAVRKQAEAREIREARAHGGPAVGPLLRDSNPLGPPPKA